MNGTRHWERGDHVILRDVYRSAIQSVLPVTVVEDSAERTALYLAVGTPFYLPADENGRLAKDPKRFAFLKKLVWGGFEQLLLARSEEAHSVVVRWAGPERRFVEWYINLQAPLRKSSLGFDSTDHALDVVISADFRRVKWKDEDQLRDLVDRGYFTEGDARGFRAEGERVIERARRREPPFNEGWERWSPDPTWTVPQLPRGWDSH